MRKATQIGFVAVICLALGVSVAGNVLLLERYRAMYYAVQTLHLDPAGRWEFGQEEDMLPPPEKPRIVFFGDSRIDMWAPLPEIDSAELVNRGLGGDTTEQMRLRFERDVLALKPDVVVVQAGVNDLKAIGIMEFRKDLLVEQCQGNLRGMIEAMADAGIHVVALTIFPVGAIEWTRQLVWSDQTIDALDTTNEMIKGLASDAVTVVDCDEVLKAGGRTHTRYALDALHLNAEGYAALNTRLAPLLAELIAPAPDTAADAL